MSDTRAGDIYHLAKTRAYRHMVRWTQGIQYMTPFNIVTGGGGRGGGGIRKYNENLLINKLPQNCTIVQ